MIAEEYLGRSRLFRRLKRGHHGHLVELYAAQLVKDELARHGTWRCLNLVGDLLSWIERSRLKLTDLDGRVVERYVKHRAGKQCIQRGDRAALNRLLTVLREAGMIAPAPLPPIIPEDRVFAGFSDYLRQERGLAPRSIISHLLVIRRFLREVSPAGASDLGNISQEDVTGYIARHARDGSAASGKGMCWSLRAFSPISPS
ncbi:site-specific integrase [Mesorhizobium sp. M0045]|uniref:site-specific integrase n=1 Tax=Mesorhizobium sp. M0045 TaxID=2956857 RepID=UPI0033367485